MRHELTLEEYLKIKENLTSELAKTIEEVALSYGSDLRYLEWFTLNAALNRQIKDLTASRLLAQAS